MKIIKLLGIAAGAAAVGLAGLAAANPGNAAETSADATDANLKTRHYKADLETFVGETEGLIPTMATYGKNWKVISAHIYGNTATIKTEVPVVFFTDDLEIKITQETAANEITVNIHSKSRVGKGDLGENKRHIRQLFKVLDEKFDPK